VNVPARSILPFLLALLLFPGAAAGEKRMSSDYAGGVLARGGWVSWTDFESGHRVYWHDGRTMSLPDIGEALDLGTDAKGRTEALYRYDGVRAMRLPRGGDRPIVEPSLKLKDVAEDHGAVAWANASGLHYRARGAKRARLVTDAVVKELGLAGRHLVAHTYDSLRNLDSFVAFDLAHPKARPRVLATDDHFDEDCRCTYGVGEQHELQASGRYAYWLDSVVVAGNGAVGNGGDYGHESYVFRIDLERRDSTPQQFQPQRLVSEDGLAVDRGQVIYGSSGEDPGVFRAPAPPWR
jgi:hypothetical protein